MKMFKKIRILSAVCLLAAGFLFSSCANATGLHNQQAAEVTFVFENFGDDISGDYTIPGNFNDWAYTTSMVTMKNGNGTSNPVTISNVNIQFTLIKTNNGWNRAWYPAVKGNGADTGTAGAPYQNFYIDGLDLNAGEITLVMDGSSGTATPYVK